MGRAMLIICAGLLVAMGYTFMNVSERRNAMGAQNVKTFNHAMAQNAAHTGVQIAIHKYNEDESNDPDDKTQEFNYAATTDGAELSLSVKESVETIDGEDTEVVKINSKAEFNNTEKTVVAVFDISESQVLTPPFVSPLNFTTEKIDYSVGGSSTITGANDEDGCPDAPAITAPNQTMVNEIEDKSKDADVGNVDVNNDVDFSNVSDLISVLLQQPDVKFIEDSNYKGSLGAATDPQITVIDQPVKLSGGIEHGYGILIITKRGDVDIELDARGNFEFNGLVIFENAYNFDATGTPNINGSIIVGTTDDYEGGEIDVNIGGGVTIQFDCRARNYADAAINNTLNTTLYKRISIYE